VVGPLGDELSGQPANCQQSLITPEVANTAAYAMEQVMSGTAAASNPHDGTAYIAKTGTTDASVHTWMVGSSTRVATAVWVGNAKGKVALRNVAINGLNAAGLRHNIFRPIAVAVDKWKPGKAFPGPDPRLVAGSPVYVPEGLVGQTPEYAKQQIELVELTYKKAGEIDSDLPEGVVAKVDPGEGSKVSRGSEVKVYVSNGSASTVPDVVSDRQSFEDAEAELAAAGFMNVAERCQVRTTEPISLLGKVVFQDPAAGSVINKDKVIRLTVLQTSCSGGPWPPGGGEHNGSGG